MSYMILRPATHEEWLEERKRGIGSSDAGTIMGVSPFQTPYGLYLQKTGKAEPVRESEAMFNGHILESAVAEWFAVRTGNIVDITSEGDWMAVDDCRPYLRVSPDRLYWDRGTPAERQTYEYARILEIKSTSKIVDKENIPDYWYCQIQYQMGIMGLERGCLCWITGAPTLHFDYLEVEFNGPFFASLVSRIDRFWNENILGGVPPAAINAEDTLRCSPVARNGSAAEASDEIFRSWRSLKDCRSRIRALQEREEVLSDAIKMAIGDCESLTYTDRETGEISILATWKNTSKEVFDEERFKADNPELWTRYSTVSEAALDRKALARDEKELYSRYSSRVASARKFMVK